MGVRGIDPGRVAELLVVTSGSDRSRGSGYRVATGAVLTAAHVVAGALDVQVRFNADRSDEWTSRGVVAWESRECDVAVVLLQETGDDVRPAAFGAVGDRDAVLECSAVGFPAFKLRKDSAGPGWFRDSCHVVGRSAVLSNRREGALEVVVSAPDRPLNGAGSPWDGMSGAALWCRGRIIGVVNKHHRSDGPGRLSATRLDRLHEWIADHQRQRLCELIRFPATAEDMSTVVPEHVEDLVEAAYAAHARELAPAVLRDREEELDELAVFCAGSDPFQWWQAPPWAGKTALCAQFVASPPAGVRVVSFFVTRSPGQDSSDAFVDAMVEQLAAIAGVNIADTVTTLAGRRGLWSHLLTKAAEQVRLRGQRLVVVVDGLDEDARIGAVGPRQSIASLLPSSPPDGVRILVTSRPHPVAGDLPGQHPLWASVRRLEPSAHARELEHRAKQELAERLHGDELDGDLVGFLAASGGGLTARDLANLTERPVFVLETRISSVFGRSLRVGPPGSSAAAVADEPTYQFAHETLLTLAEQMLVDVIAKYRHRIHLWADDFREQNWPATTPRYLLQPYTNLLVSLNAETRLCELAVDVARHDLLLRSSQSDATAFTEIHAAENVQAAHAHPDVWWSVRLAVERDRLLRRNECVPEQLPALWARLGHVERAEALARSLPDLSVRARAFTLLAEAVSASDGPMALRLVNEVIEGVAGERDPEARTQSLAHLARVMAAFNPRQALNLLDGEGANDGGLARAHRLADLAQSAGAGEREHVDELMRTAEQLVREHLDSSVDVWPTAARTYGYRSHIPSVRAVIRTIAVVLGDFDRAEELTTAIKVPFDRACALGDLVEHVATAEPSRARRLLGDAEHAFHEGCRTEPTPPLDPTLTMVRAFRATGDYDRAEALTALIEPMDLRVTALGDLACCVARTDLACADRILDRAEHGLRSVTDDHDKCSRYLVVSAAVAKQHDRMQRLADGIVDRRTRAWALLLAAHAVLADDQACARSLAVQAERLIEDLADHGSRAWLMRCLAEVSVPLDAAWAERTTARIERLTRSMADGQTTKVMSAFASAAAEIGALEQADQFADAVIEPSEKARTLALMALGAAQVDDWDAADRWAAMMDGRHTECLLPLCFFAAREGQWDRAGRWAHSIADARSQVRALSRLAEVVAGVDLRWARRLIETAEQRIEDITHESDKQRARAALSVAVALTGQWDKADEMVRPLTHPAEQVQLLRSLAAVAAEHQQWMWAQKWISAVVGTAERAYAARPAVRQAAVVHPEWAHHLSHALLVSLRSDRQHRREESLSHVLGTVSEINAGAAEFAARQLPGTADRVRALAAVATTLATCGDAERFRILADDIERELTELADLLLRIDATSTAVVAFGPVDADRSDRLAARVESDLSAIRDPRSRTRLLKRWVTITASLGQAERAERLVQLIADPPARHSACVQAVTRLLGSLPAGEPADDDPRRDSVIRLVVTGLRGQRWLEVLPAAARLDPRVITLPPPSLLPPP
ncbi:trypsin-like peptidase domain-containing protein [Saccharopolyspora taberi]|uniref:Nephrocystin 3-like N-terminal domain-containing protein n=1 Tax=Saccharopolyspora taberi TaxID=60895 RepID=A0ABN3VAY0_9PSEU